MFDVEMDLDDRPGWLAEMGEALGKAGVSIEGGGAFVTGGRGVAHFLFADGNAAARALNAAGLRVSSVREVVALKLRQGEPGQLGKLCRRMADAGVNIVVQYSDHANQLILVVNDVETAKRVALEWSGAQGAEGAEGAEGGAEGTR
jgi:prepilin-type processing-associated H-X9-DG protein